MLLASWYRDPPSIRFKIEGHSGKAVEVQLGGIPFRFICSMANKGGASEVTSLQLPVRLK